MVGKNVTAQELTIKLLLSLDPLEREGAYRRARVILSDNTRTMEQLELCVMMAGELAVEPRKYRDDFVTLAKTIIARQRHTSMKEITKKEVWITIRGTNKNGIPLADGSGNNTLDRIQDHVRELKPEEILRLCAGFEQESNRLFWENQVYLMFPNLRTMDVTDGPVLDCLQALWDSLPYQCRERAPFVLFTYMDWFEKLTQNGEETRDESLGLYAILEKEMRRVGIQKTEIYNILEMDSDTYASYRRAWCAFEKKDCTGPFPRNRLSRGRLLYLAVYLKMSFYTTVAMLAVAGYSFRLIHSDSVVAGYLLDRRYSREEALRHVHLQ